MTRDPCLVAVLLIAAVAALSLDRGQVLGAGIEARGELTGGHVVAQGNSILVKPPSKLRVTMNIAAQGNTVEEAMGDLKKRQQTAYAELEKIGANARSLRSGTVNAVRPNRSRQSSRFVPGSIRTSSRKPAASLPEKVRLYRSITAEWPLQAKSADEQFVWLADLRKTIEAVKVADAAAPAKLTPEEKEKTEEQGGTPVSSAPPSQLAIQNAVYLATITEQEEQSALADAVAKAEAEASRVAQAAGVRLGALASVSRFSGRFRSWGYGAGVGVRPDERECQSSEPGPVKCSVSVRVSYALARE